MAGHIEDIAVDTSVQGKGLGKKIINALTLLSETLGAYKVILDCSEENKGEGLLWLTGQPSTHPSLSTSFLRKVRVSERNAATKGSNTD